MTKEYDKAVAKMIATKTEALICIRQDNHDLIESKWGYEPPEKLKPVKPSKKLKQQTKLL